MNMWMRQPADDPKDSRSAPGAAARSSAQPSVRDGANASSPKGSQSSSRDVVHIGSSISIKGQLSGGEDVTLAGQFEGRVELTDYVLTVGPGARVKAELFARVIVVLGSVKGNIKAGDLIAIRGNGSVEGDLVAPRVAIEEGVTFNGRIVMQSGTSDKATAPQAADKQTKADPVAARAAAAPVN